MSLQNLQVEFIESMLADVNTHYHVREPERLCIYANNTLSALKNALIAVYPLIQALVGTDFFQQLITQYIHKYPSRSSDLHQYGAYFCDFIAEYEPCYDLIYLPEVARFEWACHAIYFAAEHAPLSVTALENISPDHYASLHFTLHPACQLHKFHYPILQIVDLCKGIHSDTVDIDAGGTNLLIYRKHNELMLMPLSESEYAFLTALECGKEVGLALSESLTIEPEFKLEQKLVKWISDKVIVDFHFMSDDVYKQTGDKDDHPTTKEGYIERFSQ